MESVSLEEVYAKLTSLEKEIKIVRTALIPEEKIPNKELKEIREINREMLRGERVNLDELLEKDV